METSKMKKQNNRALIVIKPTLYSTVNKTSHLPPEWPSLSP